MDNTRQENTCMCCGRSFITYSNSDTCSLECKQVLSKYGTQVLIPKYMRTCSMCGVDFKTNHSNQNLCSSDCQLEHARERSRIHARRKRHKPKLYDPCIICGFDITTDIHKERGEIYILCPNHHAMITRNIKTLAELQAEKERK
jgi:hypothetical protein